MLSLVGRSNFEINLSVPLVLEYEDAARRGRWKGKLKQVYIDDLLDYLCKVANSRQIHFLWRPRLKDPKDEMVLELAVASAAYAIITYNKKDFKAAEEFGVNVQTPGAFLELLGENE